MGGNSKKGDILKLMEFRLTQEQESFQQEVRGWLQQVLPRFQVGQDFIGHSDVESEDTRYSPAFLEAPSGRPYFSF